MTCRHWLPFQRVRRSVELSSAIRAQLGTVIRERHTLWTTGGETAAGRTRAQAGGGGLTDRHDRQATDGVLRCGAEAGHHRRLTDRPIGGPADPPTVVSSHRPAGRWPMRARLTSRAMTIDTTTLWLTDGRPMRGGRATGVGRLPFGQRDAHRAAGSRCGRSVGGRSGGRPSGGEVGIGGRPMGCDCCLPMWAARAGSSGDGCGARAPRLEESGRARRRRRQFPALSHPRCRHHTCLREQRRGTLLAMGCGGSQPAPAQPVPAPSLVSCACGRRGCGG